MVGGLSANAPGTENNFGLEVKQTAKGLKGTVHNIFRRTESDGVLHTYQIKSTALIALVTLPNPGGGLAAFGSKASLEDITDSLLPVSVDANTVLQVQLTDKG